MDDLFPPSESKHHGCRDFWPFYSLFYSHSLELCVAFNKCLLNKHLLNDGNVRINLIVGNIGNILKPIAFTLLSLLLTVKNIPYIVTSLHISKHTSMT